MGNDRCLTVAEMADRDHDFERNERILNSPSLCLTKDEFTEGGLRWTFQIIRKKASPHTFLWFVPHDNENAAFDTAARAVEEYGGTVISIDTGGYRRNHRQDPNRNFDIGTGAKCPLQRAPSPRFTEKIMHRRPKGVRMPIIALHSNTRGSNGDGRGGRGTISMKFPLARNTPFPAPKPAVGKEPDDTMVFVASLQPRERDPRLSAFVDYLHRNHINVMYERVSRRHNDCSFSNFAALKGIGEYAGLEVVTGDSKSQLVMVHSVTAWFDELPYRGSVAPHPVAKKPLDPKKLVDHYKHHPH